MMDEKIILDRLSADLDRQFPVSPQQPTKGFWVVDTEGRIVPANSKEPNLDAIADITAAPRAAGNIPIICAASVMFEALKSVRLDKHYRSLAPQTREMIEEALGAAE